MPPLRHVRHCHVTGMLTCPLLPLPTRDAWGLSSLWRLWQRTMSMAVTSTWPTFSEMLITRAWPHVSPRWALYSMLAQGPLPASFLVWYACSMVCIVWNATHGFFVALQCTCRAHSLCHTGGVHSVILEVFTLSYWRCSLCHTGGVHSVILEVFTLSYWRCSLCHTGGVHSVILEVFTLSYWRCSLCHTGGVHTTMCAH